MFEIRTQKVQFGHFSMGPGPFLLVWWG